MKSLVVSALFLGGVFLDSPIVAREIHFLAESKRASKLESEADVVVRYAGVDELDIGVRLYDKESRSQRTRWFSFEELKYFFERQNHKGLIAVVIQKQAWPKTEVTEQVDALRDYFVARGYKRVVILQAYSFGLGFHLDHSEPAVE